MREPIGPSHERVGTQPAPSGLRRSKPGPPPRRRSGAIRALASFCLLIALLTGAEPALGDGAAAADGRIYVPVYSSVRVLDGREQSLAVTIAVHNTNAAATLTIGTAELVGNDGAPLSDLLDAPRPLRPFETLELFLRNTDFRDATGAGLVIFWSGEGGPPLAEAVMVGTSGTMGFAFTSRGVPLSP